MKMTFYCIMMEKITYKQLNNYLVHFNILDHKQNVTKFHSTETTFFLIFLTDDILWTRS